MYPQPKKWPRYLVGAIVVLFVFKNPTAAAHLVSNLGALISQGADALSEFASALHLD
ncbi:hypothetical protein [Actinomadura xylanilytica]|uniref:hypothetical protein n=1 Tax=Actinomadura xylanilytica TaxID=887459 RepID=UPI00255AD8B6|nr:hypothetical protein [Actinomadura xylanilytica]MDL4777593.1 hypothetical protein [Actinomadura xylanilytica]